jgi:uncharacterized protein YkwD
MPTECSEPSATTTGRSTLTRRASTLGALAVGLLLLTGCLSENGQRSFDLLNQERAARGIHTLGNDADLNATAQAWAEHMASVNRLYHSTLRVPPGSTRVAENVGYGSSVDQIHQALMNSAGHRNNILDSRMTRIGIGAAADSSGRIWIVQLFAN